MCRTCSQQYFLATSQSADSFTPSQGFSLYGGVVASGVCAGSGKVQFAWSSNLTSLDLSQATQPNLVVKGKAGTPLAGVAIGEVSSGSVGTFFLLHTKGRDKGLTLKSKNPKP